MNPPRRPEEARTQKNAIFPPTLREKRYTKQHIDRNHENWKGVNIDTFVVKG